MLAVWWYLAIDFCFGGYLCCFIVWCGLCGFCFPVVAALVLYAGLVFAGLDFLSFLSGLLRYSFEVDWIVTPFCAVV